MDGVAQTDVPILPRAIFAQFSLVFGEALADTSPLTGRLHRNADEAMLARVATEYVKARQRLIGATNLGVRRPVLWSIGAIAASGHPDALRLFRSILPASASIPGAFPPVLLDVALDGRAHREMHVDGGASTQVFLYRPPVDLRRARTRERTAHVLRNGRVDVEGGSTPRGVLSIARRSAATLLHFSGLGDIQRIHLAMLRDGVGFRLAYIGSELQAERREPFDSGLMRALYD